MAICGHQFRGGDETDWIFSTSASCFDGSSTASRILQELFKKHCRSMPTKTPRKRPKTVIAPDSIIPSKPEPNASLSKEQNDNLIVRKIPGSCSFDAFDESQHLNGCPLKWLYNKKFMEKNKKYKVVRPCSRKSAKKKEVKKEKCKSFRDKTPIEVKIHKINLIEKYTSNCDNSFAPYLSYASERSKRDSKDFEIHRKKLAAKLNWKLHDESQEDGLESSSELRHNYLPPRPFLGLKPLLSVLLAPHQETNCCSVVELQSASPRKSNMKASLSIQSLELSLELSDSKSRPKTTNALRWGSKSSMLSKKLQIPNPTTIKLEDNQKKSLGKKAPCQPKIVSASSPAKKYNEKVKQAKSLSSLFYELQGKTNFRIQREKYFEEMIKDLTMEEGQFKLKRFLNVSAISDSTEKNVEAAETDSELNLVCGRVRFFDKKCSKGLKENESEEESTNVLPRRKRDLP